MGSNNVGTEPRENGSETGRIGQETLKPRPKEYVTFVTQYVQEIETAGNCIRNATKEKNNLFSDLKPDANNKGRKGHTGETE